MRPQDHARQQGFTLIETMVACVLLLGGMAATLGVLSQAGATTVKTRSREQGRTSSVSSSEAARSVNYDRLTPAGVGPAVRARPALGDSSVAASGWTIARRGITYTVSMGVRTVDDPGDGTDPTTPASTARPPRGSRLRRSAPRSSACRSTAATFRVTRTSRPVAST